MKTVKEIEGASRRSGLGVLCEGEEETDEEHEHEAELEYAEF